MNKLIIFNPSIEDGGVEKNLFLISNFLTTKIVDIILITSSFEKKKFFSKKIIFSTIPINFFSRFNKYIKYFFCSVLLIFNIIKFKRKVVVLSFQGNIYAIIISKLFRVNIVVRSNTSPKGWARNFIKKKILKFFFQITNLIIVNSHEFKKEVDEIYSVKSKVIYNPFDFHYIKKKSLESLKEKFFCRNSLKLINVGRLVDQKDQITILKAVNLALKKKNIQLIVIGKGEKKNALNRFIFQHNLEKNIKLIGYKSNPFKYIKYCDLFILSSKYEGSPNVLVEAIYLKKPIISSNCSTGPSEILKNGKLGSLFKVGDFKQLARLIINFKKNNKIIEKAFLSCKRYNYINNCEEYFRSIKSYLQ
jgi:glycosyltransferase involved in cell wall biosynthesis